MPRENSPMPYTPITTDTSNMENRSDDKSHNGIVGMSIVTDMFIRKFANDMSQNS